jgi:hypothetical protein
VFKLVLHNTRKKSSNPIEKDFDVSTNVTYEEVNVNKEAKAKESYENVEMSVQPSHQLTEGDKTNARSIKLGTSK